MGDSESYLSFGKCPKIHLCKVFGVPRTFLQKGSWPPEARSFLYQITTARPIGAAEA